MKIKLIRTRAKETLKKNKEGVIRTVLVSGLLSLIPSFFVSGGLQTSWISLILAIACLPFVHGDVKGGLMMVAGNADQVNEITGLAGLEHWKKLISTYFLMALYIFLYSFIPAIACSVIIFVEETITPLAIVVGIITVLIVIYVCLKIILTPYLLEDYQYKNGQAIDASRKLMNGHVFDLIRLFLSYLPWIILQGAATAGIMYFLQMGLPLEVSSVISILLSLLIGTYTYFPDLCLSMAIFYKELAYHTYG